LWIQFWLFTGALSIAGSGIALFTVMIAGTSFNVQIDGGSPTEHHFDGVLGCCNAGIQPAYNFKIYDNQSLSPNSHTLVLTLVNTTEGGVNYVPLTSLLHFDYAVINGTAPTSTISPSTSASPTDPRSSQSPSGGSGLTSSDQISLGVGLGVGIPGALASFAALVKFWIWWRSRHS
jgi:hypothetical protein